MSAPIALLSVYDKSNLLDLAKGLHEAGVRLLGSGGTATKIRDAGLPIEDVSSLTKAPEMLGGRVKTLHPVVHGGILARPSLLSDAQDLATHGIDPISIVVCNLYPFEDTIAKPNCTVPDAVEEIDIGGVTLLRAAAKNHERVIVLSDPKDYDEFLKEWGTKGEVKDEFKQKLALKAFEATSAYDAAISNYFRQQYASEGNGLSQRIALRYGANPHQKPAQAYVPNGSLPFKVLSGSPGYINLLDALNSYALVSELQATLSLPAATSFKHVSPAGAAIGLPLSDVEKQVFGVDDLKEELTPLACAYARARGADRMSSFGDFIALSATCDRATARIISREVSDGVIAPGFDKDALEILGKKKGGKYCILQMDPNYVPPERETKMVHGVHLEQRRNDAKITDASFATIVSKNKSLPTSARQDLTLALLALKYTQSNSVAYALNGTLIGLGAGQQSRIHCTRLAGSKADAFHLRFHPRVLALPFKAGTKRADKANAIDLFVGTEGVLEDEEPSVEKDAWFNLFDLETEGNKEKVRPLSREERKGWARDMKGVGIASDAFFPFPDNVHRAKRSGAEYVAAPRGSVMDEECVKVADEYGMVVVDVGVRLFHH